MVSLKNSICISGFGIGGMNVSKYLEVRDSSEGFSLYHLIIESLVL